MASVDELDGSSMQDDEEWPDLNSMDIRLRIRPGSACTSLQSASATPSRASTPPLQKRANKGSDIFRMPSGQNASISEHTSGARSFGSAAMSSRSISSRANSDVVAGMLDRCCNMLEELVRTPEGDKRLKRQRTDQLDENTIEQNVVENAPVAQATPTGRSVAMKLAKVCAFLGESEAASLAAERTLAELRPAPGCEFAPDSYELFVQAAGLVKESKIAIANAAETLAELQSSLGGRFGSASLIANTSALLQHSKRMSNTLERHLSNLSEMAGHDLQNLPSSSASSVLGSVNSIDSANRKRAHKARVKAVENWVDALVDDPMLGVEIPSGASSVRSVLDRVKGVEDGPSSRTFGSMLPPPVLSDADLGLKSVLQEVRTASVHGNDSDAVRAVISDMDQLITAEVTQMFPHKSTHSAICGSDSDDIKTASVHGADSDMNIAAISMADRMVLFEMQEMLSHASMQHSEVQTGSVYGVDSDRTQIVNSEVDRLFCKEMNEMISVQRFGLDEAKTVYQAVGEVLSGSVFKNANDEDSESGIQSLAPEAASRMVDEHEISAVLSEHTMLVSSLKEEDNSAVFSERSIVAESFMHRLIDESGVSESGDMFDPEVTGFPKISINVSPIKGLQTEKDDNGPLSPSLLGSTAMGSTTMNTSSQNFQSSSADTSWMMDSGLATISSEKLFASSGPFDVTGLPSMAFDGKRPDSANTRESILSVQTQATMEEKIENRVVDGLLAEIEPDFSVVVDSARTESVFGSVFTDASFEERIVQSLDLLELEPSALEHCTQTGVTPMESVRTEGSLEARIVEAWDLLGYEDIVAAVVGDGDGPPGLPGRRRGEESEGPPDLAKRGRRGEESEGPPDFAKRVHGFGDSDDEDGEWGKRMRTDSKEPDEEPGPKLPLRTKKDEEDEERQRKAKELDDIRDIIKKKHRPKKLKKYEKVENTDFEDRLKMARELLLRSYNYVVSTPSVYMDFSKSDDAPPVNKDKKKKNLKAAFSSVKMLNISSYAKKPKAKAKSKAKTGLDEDEKAGKGAETPHDFNFDDQMLHFFEDSDGEDVDEARKKKKSYNMRMLVEGDWMAKEREARFDLQEAIGLADLIIDFLNNRGAKGKTLAARMEKTKAIVQGALDFNPLIIHALEAERALRHTMDVHTVLANDDRKREAAKLKDMELMLLAALKAHNEATVLRVLYRELKYRADIMKAAYDVKELTRELQDLGQDKLARMVETSVVGVKETLGGSGEFMLEPVHMVNVLSDVKKAARALRKIERQEWGAKMDQLAAMLEAALLNHHEIMSDEAPGNRPDTFDLKRFMEFEKVAKSEMKESIKTGKQVMKDLVILLEEAKSPSERSEGTIIAMQNQKITQELIGMLNKILEYMEIVLYVKGQVMLDQPEMEAVEHKLQQVHLKCMEYDREEAAESLKVMIEQMQSAIHKHYEATLSIPPPEEGDEIATEPKDEVEEFMDKQASIQTHMKEAAASGQNLLVELETHGRQDLVELVATAMGKVDQARAEGVITFDLKGVEAALEETVQVAKKLKAEGQTDEAGKMKKIAQDLQASILAHQSAQAYIASKNTATPGATPAKVVPVLSQEGQQCVEKEFEAVLEGLAEESRQDLVDLIVNTVGKVDQVMNSGGESVDVSVVEAALDDVVITSERLRAEGQIEEAIKMERVAEKLQECLEENQQVKQANDEQKSLAMAQVSEESQEFVEKNMEMVLEKLQEDGREDLVETVLNTIEKIDTIISESSRGGDALEMKEVLEEVTQTTEKLRAEGQFEEADRLSEVVKKLQVCFDNERESPAPKMLQKQGAHRATAPSPTVQVSEESEEFVEKKMEAILEKLQEDGREDLGDLVETVSKVDQAIKESVSSKDAQAIEQALDEARLASEQLKLQGHTEEAVQISKVVQELQVCLDNHRESSKGEDREESKSLPRPNGPPPTVQVSEESEEFVEKKMEAILEKLQEDGRADLEDLVETISKVDQAIKESVSSKDAQAIEQALDEARLASEQLKLQGLSEEAVQIDKVVKKLEDCLPVNQNVQGHELQSKLEVPSTPAPLITNLQKMFVNKQLDVVLDKLNEDGREDLAKMVSEVNENFKEGTASKDAQTLEVALEGARLASEQLKLEGQIDEAAKMDKVAQKLEDCLATKDDAQKSVPPAKEVPVVSTLSKVFVQRQLESVVGSLKEEKIPEEILTLVENVGQALKEGANSKDLQQVKDALSDAQLASQKLKVEGQTEEAARMEKVAQKLQECVSNREKAQKMEQALSKLPDSPQQLADDKPQWLQPSPLVLKARGGLGDEPLQGAKQLPALKTPPKLLTGAKPPQGLRDSRSEPNLHTEKGVIEIGNSSGFRSGGKKEGTLLLPPLIAKKRHRLHKSKMTESLPSISEGSISEYGRSGFKTGSAAFSTVDAERAIRLLRDYKVQGGIDILEMLKEGCLPQFFCRPL